MTNSDIQEFEKALASEASRYHVGLGADEINTLAKYYRMVQTWNPRLNLVASCSPKEFATRHILESLMALEHLPQHARVADIGSGAGLPIIPCLAVRPDLEVTIIESSPRKAIFLREAIVAVRSVHAVEFGAAARVIMERFENIPVPAVEFITCRALERFAQMVHRLLEWSPSGATLLLFAGDNLREKIEEAKLDYTAEHIPDSERRYLLTVHRL